VGEGVDTLCVMLGARNISRRLTSLEDSSVNFSEYKKMLRGLRLGQDLGKRLVNTSTTCKYFIKKEKKCTADIHKKYTALFSVGLNLFCVIFQVSIHPW